MAAAPIQQPDPGHDEDPLLPALVVDGALAVREASVIQDPPGQGPGEKLSGSVG